MRENQKSFTNHKQRKYSIDETKHEEPLVTDNPVIKQPNYFNLFECGKIS